MNGAEQMSADSEEILDDAVHRCKTLQMGSRLEPAHLAFPLAGRLMRDFRAIVFILPGTVDHGRMLSHESNRAGSEPISPRDPACRPNTNDII